MWAGATPDWLDALTRSHQLYTHVEVWFAGAKAADLDIQSGSVQVTARNRVRRTATFVVAEEMWPRSATDLLAPFGAEIRAWRGIRDAAGAMVGQPAPVFAGRVESVSRQRLSGAVEVVCSDRFAAINDFQFETPRTPDTRALLTSVIRQFVFEAGVPASFVDMTGRLWTVPASIMWQYDRGQAIDDLATALGAEVYITADGQQCVVRPIPTLDDPPVWTLRADTDDAVIVSDAQGRSRTDVANKIIVDVERAGDTPLLVTVVDVDPASPTRWGGPYGKVVRHLSNALVTDAAQAVVAGQARLSRVIGITRTREIQCVPNPALEAGDVIQVETSEGTEKHLVDAFTLPLDVGTPMQIQTRSVTSTTSDGGG
ncbi:MAG TPA: DUF5047 domain-containing protein [Kutzneria sp.]|jgi:hypothetical protein|nr:DUF5047 domain-containing protein [Kutzneria sp.]